jgi:polysaccharide chain length determinant protein (PEP-CTERM system associated)
MAWRWRWVILAPTLVIGLGVAAWSWTLPNRYRSEAVILVVPQRVPKEFVRSTVSSEVDERLQTISQQILSRTRLERIILDFNLYPEERRSGIMEDVVETMRTQDVSISIGKTRRGEDSTSFRVGYVADRPRTAMQVTERLASLFIEENLRDRELLAEGTDQFLESQLEEARRQLLENERKLEEYKRRYMGQLPTQLQANLTVLQNTQGQLQSLAESVNRDRDQRTILQRMLSDVLAAPPPPKPVATAQGGQTTVPVTTQGQLEAARAQLATLLLRLKPEHPDVVRARRLVEELESKVATEALSRPVSPQAPPEGPITVSDPAQQRRVDELRAQIATLDSQVASKQREEDRLRGLIGAYQARVEATPGRESELVALTRDYDTLRTRYQQLLSKREDARIASNLEKRQVGEQFKIIDPARLPERPESPDRVRINIMGSLAGLALGLGLAALLVYRDTSVRTEDDVLVALALPVLACIPRLTTSLERRRRRRRRLAVSMVTALVVCLGLAAALWRLGFLTGRL